jgi:hypothetical protein
MKTLTFTAPAYLAPYFLNGDVSSITPDEARRADAILEAEGVAHVLAMEPDSERFTWNGRLFHSPVSGVTVADFTGPPLAIAAKA